MNSATSDCSARVADAAVYAYIGLGSNLHDPLQQVTRAFAALDDLPAMRHVTLAIQHHNLWPLLMVVSGHVLLSV